MRVRELTNERYHSRDAFAPNRPRDFDFQGDYPHLIGQLRKDSRETGCESYTIYQTFLEDSPVDSLWAVWRDQ